MRIPPMRRLLSSLTVVWRSMAPASSAAATVNAFITDPGSYCRLTAGSVKRAGGVLL